MPYRLTKRYSFNISGVCDCITTFTTDNNIMETFDKKICNLKYHPNPTKEDLIEYFAGRFGVRKLTPREALRIMDVEDTDIDKLINAKEETILKSGERKTTKAISKTNLFKMAGNSIVVSCLYHIFRTLFIPNQSEYAGRDRSLFD